jgi:ribosomal protein S18 acetylase RimI-like enzyme
MNSRGLSSLVDLTNVEIRSATVDDLPSLVEIHKVAYPKNHFTSLLPDKVLSKYYESFLVGSSEICIATLNGSVMGFAVYGRGIPRKIDDFKKNAYGSIFITALKNPIVSIRKSIAVLASKLIYHDPCPKAEFLLLSIAVLRLKVGVGRKLLSHLIMIARQRGESDVGLFVNSGNINAINAYFASGFVLKEYLSGQFYMEKSFDK